MNRFILPTILIGLMILPAIARAQSECSSVFDANVQISVSSKEETRIHLILQTSESDSYAKLVSRTIVGKRLDANSLRISAERLFSESQSMVFSPKDQNLIWDSFLGKGSLEHTFGRRVWGTTEVKPNAERIIRNHIYELNHQLATRGENPGFSLRKGLLLDTYLLKFSGLDKKPSDPVALKSYARFLYIVLSEQRFTNEDVLRPIFSGTYERVLPQLANEDRELVLAGVEIQRPTKATYTKPNAAEALPRKRTHVGQQLAELIQKNARGDRQRFLKFLATDIRDNRVPQDLGERNVYRVYVIKFAQELNFPSYQMDFIRRLTAAQKDVAVELLEGAGL